MILLRCVACILVLLGTTLRAETVYPSRPIKLIVPYPAGSLVDLLGRSIADALSMSLKQPVIVDNKPGASTLIGAMATAGAAPDGYTLLIPTVTTLSIAPQLVAKPGIDPLKDFTPISRLGATSFFLVVHPSFPARTMQEWIDQVRRNPGKYTYASAGVGTPHHIFMEQLKKQLGLDIVHVPYKGSSSAMTDLIAGRVDMAFLDGTLAIPNIKTESLFAVGISMAKRSVLMTAVPPIAETVPGFDWSGWIAVAGPANMPAPIVKLLSEEIRKLQQTPHFADLLRQAAMEPMEPLSSDAMAEFVSEEYARWGPAIKASGATVE